MLSREDFEGILRGGLHSEAVDLFLLRRVDFLREKFPRTVALFPGIGDRDFGPRAEREHVFFACETISEAPELRAFRLYEKMQSVAVGELVGLPLQQPRIHRLLYH